MLVETLLLLIFFTTPLVCDSDDDWLSPEYGDFFQTALPIPPEIKPLTYVRYGSVD